jgi:hypothetical protein
MSVLTLWRGRVVLFAELRLMVHSEMRECCCTTRRNRRAKQIIFEIVRIGPPFPDGIVPTQAAGVFIAEGQTRGSMLSLTNERL